MKIGKQDLVVKISEKTGFTKKDTEKMLNAFLETIQQSMENHNDVVIPGFGAWKIQRVSERKGRDLHSDKEIIIPEHDRVKFTPGSDLKKAVTKTEE